MPRGDRQNVPTRGRAALTVALLCAGALDAGLANAQAGRTDPAPHPSQREGETIVDAATWRAIVAGRTVHWRENGLFSGREYYARSGPRVIFIDVTGKCYVGRWGPKLGGAPGELCFRYEGEGYAGTHCDLHLRKGEKLFARRPSGSETVVIKMTDEVLSCGQAPTS